MVEKHFGIHGVSVSVKAYGKKQHEVLSEIVSDFERLMKSDSKRRSLIKLYLVEHRRQRRLPGKIFTTDMCTVYGWGARRVCNYGAVLAESRWVNGTRCFWISGSDLVLLREVCYTTMLSALGEELDVRGFHRIHALGFEMHGRRGLVVGDSGIGKSSLACLLTDPTGQYENLKLRLFSDESPLLAKGLLQPYPLRLALAPNVAKGLGLKEGPLFQRRLYGAKQLLRFPTPVAQAGPVDFLLVGLRTEGDVSILKANRFRLVGFLAWRFVIGSGVAQMSEWMLRPRAVPRLIRIAISRSRALFDLLLSTPNVYIFRLGTDARINAQFLIHELELQSVQGPSAENNAGRDDSAGRNG